MSSSHNVENVLTQEQRDAIVSAIITDVCELPDYTSPDDQPELLQCTVSQLELCIRRGLGEDV